MVTTLPRATREPQQRALLAPARSLTPHLFAPLPPRRPSPCRFPRAQKHWQLPPQDDEPRWFESEASKLCQELEAAWKAAEAQQGDTKKGDAKPAGGRVREAYAQQLKICDLVAGWKLEKCFPRSKDAALFIALRVGLDVAWHGARGWGVPPALSSKWAKVGAGCNSRKLACTPTPVLAPLPLQ
jgi:hypothetical protein